jgi:3-hydroxybutyryl-CoA dehydratase
MITFTEADIKDIKVGMTESFTKTITDVDVKMYAELSGDVNPVHIDEDYAKKSRFGRKIAHGLFSAGFFSAIFGTKLPGTGCVYVSQNLNFKRPVYIDDMVVATVTVLEVDQKSKKVKFKTECKVKQKVVIDGSAVIFIPGKK